MKELNKRMPTDEELEHIEKELEQVDINAEIEEDLNQINISQEEFKEKVNSLTEKELEAINEMARIIENPNYISYIRRRRIELENKKEERKHEHSIIEEFSFDNDIMKEYDDDNDLNY